MPLAWMLLLLTLGPEPLVITERVETIEHQYVYDDRGELIFSQFIFRNDDEHYSIRDYRMANSVGKQRVYRHRDGYRLLWHDGGQLRSVMANELRVIHEQHDQETVERERLPKEMRRELRKRR